MKKIYIIQAHTGTVPARLIKLFTKKNYTHISLSFNKSLNKMYSFGRRTLNNPLNAGFVTEDINGIFFEKFKNTNCRIYELEIPYFKYFKLKSIIKKYEKDPLKYDYDIIGLLTRAIKINIKRKNKYICSQFIAEVLKESNIYDFKRPTKTILPIDFDDFPYKILYEGKMVEYKRRKNEHI